MIDPPCAFNATTMNAKFKIVPGGVKIPAYAVEIRTGHAQRMEMLVSIRTNTAPYARISEPYIVILKDKAIITRSVQKSDGSEYSTIDVILDVEDFRFQCIGDA